MTTQLDTTTSVVEEEQVGRIPVVLPHAPGCSQVVRGVDERQGGEADGAAFPEGRGVPGCGAAYRGRGLGYRLERKVLIGVRLMNLMQ